MSFNNDHIMMNRMKRFEKLLGKNENLEKCKAEYP